jgi:internalin A
MAPSVTELIEEGYKSGAFVRTHALSEGLPRWRTGVILKFEQNRALVKADMHDKKVFISVTGPTSTRRQLLAIVRSDMDRIHRDIRNLQSQAIVPLPQYPHEHVSYTELTVLEQKGIKSFVKVVGDEVLSLDVDQLLNGIDLEGSRTKTPAVTLFYSYAHKDERLRDELETHLKLLERRGLIGSWHDRRIEAGEEWKQKINDNLEVADIILLLISADFIALRVLL